MQLQALTVYSYVSAMTFRLTAWEVVHKHEVENTKHMIDECTQPQSHAVSFIIHMIYYWQVQVGVKSGTASEKYVMHGTNTIQMFKVFPSAERRGATSGLWLLGHCSVQVGDGLGFQPEVCP